jgi:hypothetical protein
MSSTVVFAQKVQSTNNWVDLVPDRVTETKPRSDVTVTLSISSKNKNESKAFIRFAGDAAEWISACGPMFKVQVDINKPNHVKIIPDFEGKYQAFRAPKSTIWRMHIGVPKIDGKRVWPNEARKRTNAENDCGFKPDWLRFELPDDFLIPSKK